MEHDNISFVIQDPASSRFALLKARHEYGCFDSFDSSSVTPSFFITFSINQIKIFECISASSNSAPRLVCTYNLTRLELEIIDAKLTVVDDQPCVIYQTIDRQAKDQNLWVLNIFGGEALKTSFPLLEQSNILSVSKGPNLLNQTHLAVAHANQIYVGFLSRSNDNYISSETQVLQLSSKNSTKISCVEVFETKQQDWCLFVVGTEDGCVETWKMGSDGDFESLFTISSGIFVTVISVICKSNQKSDLFLGHASSGLSSQLISRYYIDEDFSTATKVLTMNNAAVYRNPKGKIKRLKLSNYAQESPVLYSLYELPNAVCYFEAFDVVTNKSLYQVELKERILDFVVNPKSPQCTILFEDHLAKYFPEEKISDEKFEPYYSKTPGFDAVFSLDAASFAYNSETRVKITSMRSSLENELLFDKLLLDTKIPVNFYPPQDRASLKTLFDLIIDSPASVMVKNCLIYYLLKDASSTKAEHFAQLSSLSRPFVIAVNGFWSLDHGYYAEAVRFLSDPAVDLSDPPGQLDNFGWSEKIILSLYKNKQYSLGLLFIQTTGPSLVSEKIIKSVLEILSKTYLLGALDFQRKFCSFDIESSLHLIFEECFSNVKTNKELLSQLVTAPFNGYEERILLDYCRQGNSVVLHDFLLNFFIQRGRFAEALQTYNTLFVAKGLGDNPKRQNVMKNVGMLLPKTQLLALGLPIPAYIPQDKIQTALSQSSLIRDGAPTQRTVLQALQENYVSSMPEPVAKEKPVFGLPEDNDVEMKSVNVETPSKIKVASSANVTPGPARNSVPQSPSSPFIQPPFTFRSEEKSSTFIEPPRQESIATTNFSASPYISSIHGISDTPKTAEKPPRTSWSVSQTPVPIRLHSNSNSLTKSSKPSTSSLEVSTPPLISRSPLTFKDPTPPKPTSTPFIGATSVELSFSTKTIINYPTVPVEVYTPMKPRSPIQSRDSSAQTTPENRVEIQDAPPPLPRQDEVDMDIDNPDMSMTTASTRASSHIVSKGVAKSQKPSRSIKKLKKTKSAPTSEISPRRLRNTPARVKSNPSTPSLSRESSPVKESALQETADKQIAETRSKSAGTSVLKSPSPENSGNSKSIAAELETGQVRSTRTTRSAKTKVPEPSDAVWRKSNNSSSRLNAEHETLSRPTSSLRKQIASKTIKKKEAKLDTESSVVESVSASTIESDGPLTRARRKNLTRSETK